MAGCAATSSDSKAVARGIQPPPDTPIVGWRCAEYARLPGQVRAALFTPVIPVERPAAAREPAPLRYEFNLYRDSVPLRTVIASLSWLDAGEDLRRSSPHLLFFALREQLEPDESLRFDGPDGSVIRLAPQQGAVEVARSPPNFVYINIKSEEKIEQFLRNSRYEVTFERRNEVRKIGNLNLFSYDDAVHYYATMLEELKKKAANPQKHCDPVYAPEEPGEEAIV